MNAFPDLGKFLSFHGIYLVAMVASFIFLLATLFYQPLLWPFVLVFGMILVYYDMDFVSHVKERKAPFRALGYFALVALMFMGVGIVFVVETASGILLLLAGIVLAGPGFYFYRRSQVVRIEYGGR